MATDKPLWPLIDQWPHVTVVTLIGHPRHPSCSVVHSSKSKEWRVGHRSCHPIARVNGDNDELLIVVIVTVLHIDAGLVSALLSISRLTPNLDGPEGTYQK